MRPASPIYLAITALLQYLLNFRCGGGSQYSVAVSVNNHVDKRGVSKKNGPEKEHAQQFLAENEPEKTRSHRLSPSEVNRFFVLNDEVSEQKIEYKINHVLPTTGLRGDRPEWVSSSLSESLLIESSF
jgi:hypothetical protein